MKTAFAITVILTAPIYGPPKGPGAESEYRVASSLPGLTQGDYLAVGRVVAYGGEWHRCDVYFEIEEVIHGSGAPPRGLISHCPSIYTSEERLQRWGPGVHVFSMGRQYLLGGFTEQASQYLNGKQNINAVIRRYWKNGLNPSLDRQINHANAMFRLLDRSITPQKRSEIIRELLHSQDEILKMAAYWSCIRYPGAYDPDIVAEDFMAIAAKQHGNPLVDARNLAVNRWAKGRGGVSPELVRRAAEVLKELEKIDTVAP